MPSNGGEKTKRTRNQLGSTNRDKHKVRCSGSALLPCNGSFREITIDVSKISCKEFMLPGFIMPDDIAYWISGYYNGRRGNTVLDVVGLRDYVNKVEQYCIANKEMTVMKAAEAVINGAK